MRYNINSMKKKILVIDDDTYICNLLENFLTTNGYHTDIAFSGSTGIKKINENEYDLILCDYRLPDSDGLKIVSLTKKKNLFTPIVIMTAYADVKMAVKLIKSGAIDYVTKPIYPEEILQLLKRNLDGDSNRLTSKTFEQQFITGDSQQFRKILQDVQSISPTDVTVLIEGETGTGKEYVARAIHYKSKRKNKPFVAVDCGALPRDLANSELFGHIKGAFTGAVIDKRGYFEQAHGGTLFLDEIGNLSLENQLKMLRVLQEKAVSRLGDEKKIDVDVRIIVATNENLKLSLKNNTFREDLYHRINVVKIVIPPLRERKEDVLLFAAKFVEKSNLEFGKDVTGISDDAGRTLISYPWYGNIRELENVIKRSVLLASSNVITIQSLPEEIRSYSTDSHLDHKFQKTAISSLELKEATAIAEKEIIVNALEETNYNKTQAAKLLNIDRKTLYNKLKQLEIDSAGE